MLIIRKTVRHFRSDRIIKVMRSAFLYTQQRNVIEKYEVGEKERRRKRKKTPSQLK